MPGFYLEHLQGERAGATDHVDKDVVRVGRSAEFELCFDEMGVSWEHAEIRKRDGDWWVIDRGSTNGTYVNDERAHNARLRDGDVLKFGKKGPILRFKTSLAPAAAVASAGEPLVAVPPAAPPPPASVAAVPGPPPVRAPRKRMPSEREVAVLDERLLADARSDLPPAAPRPTSSPWTLALLASFAVLFVVAAGVAGWLWVEGQTREDALRAEKTRAGDLERSLRTAELSGAEKVGQLRREKEEIEGELRRAREELDRARRRAEEDTQRLNDRVAQLERELTAARARRDRVPPAQPNPDQTAPNWKAISQRLSPSVLLICTDLQGRTKAGQVVSLRCYGTGFFASSSGHIITNKHVIEPWKFRPMAERITAEGIEVIDSSYQIHVWPAGLRFVRRDARDVDPATAFSTASGSLQVLRTAPDKWILANLPGDKGPRQVRIHDEHSNDDLAVLKAAVQSPVTAIPVGSSDSADTLDEVLVLGFPAGPNILESGMAVTSPADGKVRKVEDTILVTAVMIGGNSGGPLIDKRGRVIGVCTRVADGIGSCLRIEHAVALLQGGRW